MSLFRKAGEKFEETKQTFVDGGNDEKEPEEAETTDRAEESDTPEDGRCENCGDLLAEDYEFCPHCGEQIQ